MAKVKLTKSAVDASQSQTKAVELRDTLVRGFLCKITPAGRKMFMLQYRTNAGDPYIVDFFGLRDTWQEGDLEAATIREMESLLLKLGVGFTFVARQKRIQIDDDFHLDLLFYNRKLRRLVAVEFEIGEFKAAYKGQMGLDLRWLDKHEHEPEEASPFGIILCTGKKP
ncbi:PDDEXK nuclease domain-containing protein [Rahnella aceris]|uniref:PDDEXK nuclease domain-containing protein n=1 Tax=Rahnella sp. (strain Y9602) TaxID=2703885 RepID=UPI003F58E6AD